MKRQLSYISISHKSILVSSWQKVKQSIKTVLYVVLSPTLWPTMKHPVCTVLSRLFYPEPTLDCTFDDGDCGYTSTVTGNVLWDLTSGRFTIPFK